jgi:hypothetical protein
MLKITFIIPLLLFSAFLMAGCTTSAENTVYRNVHYQVALSDGITGYAEYTIASDEMISHSIPNEWLSNTFTLEAGSEISFILNGDVEKDEAEISIRIFVDDHQAKKENFIYRVADSESYKITIPVFYTLE